ncbi:MAG: hypothetical protein COU85_01205 [Candidatus Portnoybacteria bacterium CG10_big_fil_rev_8_21_14_0_10_44_7]|uniref:Radical SAM core domain-containing protein n=1 Tax=Candidatus Portnoybacteria bacterium CG10_big_fil_rev_8_21_14_0_10_44_7 TaxID=1974816 RepID=A0A2M8KJ08_9BACT|nr:MAG: hypothetical protein COU85_01205 [Candidatus Portnoybacteria bacterium CG10_big_fil_rev_8_21_14_0_10_44_7]
MPNFFSVAGLKLLLFSEGRDRVAKLIESVISGERYFGGPIISELDMTAKCNQRCPACTGGHVPKTARQNLAAAKKHLRQLKEIGCLAVIFTGGGDPLCGPFTPAAVTYARKLGFLVGLMTNGYFLNRLDWTSVDLLASNCFFIRVSLDAGSAAMYAQTHGVLERDFKEVLSGLANLVRIKKALGASCEIGTGYLTGKKTIILAEMEQFVRLSLDRGVDFVQFRPFHGDFSPVEKEVAQIKNGLPPKLAAKILVSVQKYNQFPLGGKKISRPYDACWGANFATVVGADQRMYICCHNRGASELCFGDLKKESLSAIWAGRNQIISRVDFSRCVSFCRCDAMNAVLQKLINLARSGRQDILKEILAGQVHLVYGVGPSGNFDERRAAAGIKILARAGVYQRLGEKFTIIPSGHRYFL